MIQLIREIPRLFQRDLSISHWDRMLDYSAFGWPTESGQAINEYTALQLPAVYACINLIAKTGASLPGHVYQRVGGNDRRIARSHYLYPLIHDMANPWLPSMEWVKLVLAHLNTWGNHYSWIKWSKSNRPESLWPLPPDSIVVKRDSVTDPIHYFWRDGNELREIPAMDMLHIRGLGFDGTVGYSPISLMRETLGLGASTTRTAAKLQKNGITARVVLEYSGSPSKDQAKKLREDFEEANSGGKSSVILAPFGSKVTPISINPSDAEFLAQWKLNAVQIYQIFGVPPHMVGDTEKVTSWGTGIEQQKDGFVTFTMMPLMGLIETWLAVKLLPDRDRNFVEYDFKGLMRADSNARANWYKTMIDIGAYSPNHVLRSENENPYPGGDVFRRPLNTAFIDEAGNVVQVTPPSSRQEDDSQDVTTEETVSA